MMIGDDASAPFFCAMTRPTPLLPPQEDAPNPLAPQHGPRPLPLFLAHLWRETENDPILRRKALQGLRAYQRASRLIDAYERPVYSQCGAARLLRIGDCIDIANRVRETGQPLGVLINADKERGTEGAGEAVRRVGVHSVSAAVG